MDHIVYDKLCELNGIAMHCVTSTMENHTYLKNETVKDTCMLKQTRRTNIIYPRPTEKHTL